jgi:very-short-patch-repair endonuclease
MKLEEFLGIWQLTAKKRSVPIGYTALCREIEKLDPEEVGYKVIRRLEEEGFISTLPNGHRILTDIGLSKRIPLPVRPVVIEKSNEQNWARFRRLCAYYADCVTQSEKTQEYLFEQDLNNKYLMPPLPIDWLSNHDPMRLTFSNLNLPAVNRIKSRRDDAEDLYIGYPLSAFHDSRNKMVFSPILLFPVDVTFDTSSLEVLIRRDEIDINRTWLEYNVARDDQKDVLTSICFSEGEKTGLLDVEVAVRYLANRFNAGLAPNHLDYNVAHRPRGIVNSAALFVGNPLKYSKTLKKELREISNQPPHVLDQTALAYVFRDPPLENQYEMNPGILPLDFLEMPSNYEQHEALKQALNLPTSKVTGPPGTGKSQVAVNLIANLAFNGQSALFTSKNHKAIHAIIQRAESIMPKLPLVQFCTTEDGSAGAVWSNLQIDYVVAQSEVIKQQKGFTDDFPLMRKFEDSLENMRDFETLFAEINDARAALQGIQAKYDQIFPNISVSLDTLSVAYCQQLEKLANRIGLHQDTRTLLQRFFDFLLLRKYRAHNAEAELRKLLPEIAATAKNPETLRKRVLRLCGDIADYLAIKDEEDLLSEKILELPEDDVKKLSEELAFRREHLGDIFLAKRVLVMQRVPDNIRQNLKDAAQRIARQNLPFLAQILPASSIEEAQDSFKQFANFFPAWATTLLSLSKASPCVAGLFDRVIIDEASQCEIPPIIPALYRAKGMTVIGDPAQFPPVITMREARHAHIRFFKHKLTDLSDERFDFMKHNAFDVVAAHPLMLREHFRCHADIADYFNEEYYTDKLKVRTHPENLKFPRNMGFRRALEWRNVHDSVEDEIAEVKKLMQDLRQNQYDGEIGVISPFRKVADRLKQELYSYQPLLDVDKDVNTANGFQGGERDLIIFVLGITNNLTRGEDWYAVAEENRYIYNVAVSRARACLIVVGDREKARQSKASALRNLAKNIEQRPRKALSQSPGEEMLYKALCEAGFDPKQQYPLVGRYLDLALVNEKIDIEVDGEGFHLNRFGERKHDDIYRDLQVASAGWRVCRFWYREVRDNLSDCIDKVQQTVKNR